MAEHRNRTPFGKRMFEAREAAGLTQKAVQARTGIAQSTLSDIETKAANSSHTPVLAALYGADAHLLATGMPAPNARPEQLAGAFAMGQYLSNLMVLIDHLDADQRAELLRVAREMANRRRPPNTG